jgi:hypothetical protein
MKFQKAYGFVQLVFAVGVVLWWLLFFLEFRHDPANSREYLAFEGSFPPADLGWLTPLLLASAWGNLQWRRLGLDFTLMSGAVLVFLGLLDASFNMRNGVYARSLTDGVLNASINAACLVFGLASVVWALRRQR